MLSGSSAFKLVFHERRIRSVYLVPSGAFSYLLKFVTNYFRRLKMRVWGCGSEFRLLLHLTYAFKYAKHHPISSISVVHENIFAKFEEFCFDLKANKDKVLK